MSRYDQLKNKNKLTEKEYQELKYYIDKKTLGNDGLINNNNN
jgi:hypothetical protein